MGSGGLLAACAGVFLGAVVALQSPINALLGRALASPMSAALVSLAVSCVSAAAIHAGLGPTAEWRAAPLWLYLAGGIIGATFVIGSLLVVPRLGATSFLACVVLGQLLAGLSVDHLGAFGLPVHEVSVGRLAAAGLVLLGVVLLRLA